MNEQPAHIVTPTYYIPHHSSQIKRDDHYTDKLVHWNTRSYSPLSFPPENLHIHYPMKGERKEEKPTTYRSTSELHHDNERQWSSDWTSSVADTVNLSKMDVGNESQHHSPHTSYVHNNNNNGGPYVVSPYSSYDHVNNSGDISLNALQPNNTHELVHASHPEHMYIANCKLNIKNKKYFKQKYYFSETDWNYQNMASKEQMYKQYDNETERSSSLNSQFAHDIQIYNKEKETIEPQTNALELTHNNNWNIPSTNSNIDNSSIMIENMSQMPILEKIDKKNISDVIRVEKINTYTELKTYTPPSEREMPILERIGMSESYEIQNELQPCSSREQFSELNEETLYDKNFDKLISQEIDNSSPLSSMEILSHEKKPNPRTQAIRNMKRMRTSFYMKPDEQIPKDWSQFEEDNLQITEIPLEQSSPKKNRRSHKKHRSKIRKLLAKQGSIRLPRNLVKFNDVYLPSDIDTEQLIQLGQEKLIIEKLPNSVFDQHKIRTEFKDEDFPVLPSLKMTLRINRQDYIDGSNYEYGNNEESPLFEITSKNGKETFKRTVKSNTSTIGNNSNGFSSSLQDKFDDKPIRLPLKLKIKLPNRDLINYRQNSIDQISVKTSDSFELEERSCRRDKILTRNKSNVNNIRMTNTTTRIKRSSVDYGPDAYYHLLNIDELWDVLDDDNLIMKETERIASYIENDKDIEQIQIEEEEEEDNNKTIDLQPVLDDLKENNQAASPDIIIPDDITDDKRFECKPQLLYNDLESNIINEMEDKTANNQLATARKSILLSVKGDEVYDYVFRENMDQDNKNENLVYEPWKCNVAMDETVVPSQTVCDNIPEENQNNTQDNDMYVMTKNKHSRFFLNSNCNKIANRTPHGDIAQSSSYMFPPNSDCSTYNQQSVIYQNRSQSPLVLKEYRNFEPNFLLRHKYPYISRDVNNQPVIESNNNNSNINLFGENAKEFDVSVITPLNQDKT